MWSSTSNANAGYALHVKVKWLVVGDLYARQWGGSCARRTRKVLILFKVQMQIQDWPFIKLVCCGELDGVRGQLLPSFSLSVTGTASTPRTDNSDKRRIDHSSLVPLNAGRTRMGLDSGL